MSNVRGSAITLDNALNVGPDLRMRGLAHRSKNHDVYLLPENAAAALPAAPRSAVGRAFRPSRPGILRDKPASVFTEPPAETDAWWLSRSQAATFARRRIALSDECARALRAAGDALEQIVVEFNGASFRGAALAASEGRYQLELGDALAQEMASVLDEDDGLAVEVVTGRSQPTLAIHPYVSGAS